MGANVPVISDQQRMRSTEMLRSYCDNEEARALLGWSPRVDLSTGLKETIQYLIDTENRQAVAGFAPGKQRE
jgi:nucleoside-diphosphate-sugar epimerase